MSQIRNSWRVIPLKNVILSILSKNNGIILDDTLITRVRKEYGEVSNKELNDALMQLELSRLIHVSAITKTKRRIEFIKSGQQYLAIGED
ncbi:MAG: hypothetical protein ACXACA_03335 [Candidatus Ranarchaeia archaeon]|jgi:Fe2+ or Zn2+ uptake regulation protein